MGDGKMVHEQSIIGPRWEIRGPFPHPRGRAIMGTRWKWGHWTQKGSPKRFRIGSETVLKYTAI